MKRLFYYFTTLIFVFIFSSLIISSGNNASWSESTKSDFSQGTMNNIELLSPDPDGLDDGALRLRVDASIKVLQIYPDGHNTTVVKDAVYKYMASGTPPVNFYIDILPKSKFNTAKTVDDIFVVTNPQDGSTATRAISYYDVLYFGVADWNGAPDSAGDLTTSATEVVRSFAKLGKGIIFTHDTIENHPPTGCSGSCYGAHPNYNSLTDVSGLQAPCFQKCYQTFTNVKLISTDTSNPVLTTPFLLPTSFNVKLTHWLGQQVVSGDIWYAGNVTEPNLYGLYMHTYYNPDYNSYSGFFSYGHTESAPEEFEAKAMINTMYHSYQGGAGNGYYISKTYFTECSNIQWGTSEWRAETPGKSSLKVYARTSLDGIQWSEWYPLANGAPMDIEQGQFFEYKVTMATDTSRNLPILHSITFNFSCPLSCVKKPK